MVNVERPVGGLVQFPSDHDFGLPPPWTFHLLKLQPQEVARNDPFFTLLSQAEEPHLSP